MSFLEERVFELLLFSQDYLRLRYLALRPGGVTDDHFIVVQAAEICPARCTGTEGGSALQTACFG